MNVLIIEVYLMLLPIPLMIMQMKECFNLMTSICYNVITIQWEIHSCTLITFCHTSYNQKVITMKI